MLYFEVLVKLLGCKSGLRWFLLHDHLVRRMYVVVSTLILFIKKVKMVHMVDLVMCFDRPFLKDPRMPI